jgi:hypothetical protein
MSAQRYTAPLAHERMDAGLCPECGGTASNHLDDNRFWLPRTCDLLPRGVEERVLQYRADKEAEAHV